MAVYGYKALNEIGKKVDGVIDANTPREARDKLREGKMHVTSMRELAARKGQKKTAIPTFRPRYFEDISIYTRQLSTLLSSGMPIAEALGALIEQIDRKVLETVFRDLREQIVQGASLGEALDSYPLYFSDLYVNMVKAGEATGDLDGILRRLADYLAAQNRIRNRVMAALAYPLVLISIAILVVIFLLTFVVPKIVGLLEQQEAVLPLPTRILIGVNELLIGYWWAFIIGTAALVFLARLILMSDSGRRWFDGFVLRIPVVGALAQKAAVSRFAITFSALLKSGIPALEGLKIVRSVIRNSLMKDTLQEVHDRVLEGADISLPMKRSKIFPPIVGYMVATGEKSGELPAILERLAEAYDEELDLAIQKVMALIEPLIIVFLAVVVGGIVLSVILPILQLSQGMSN